MQQGLGSSVSYKLNLDYSVTTLFVLLASANKTYIGSVLFRASAFTGAKLASRVPAVIGCFGP